MTAIVRATASVNAYISGAPEDVYTVSVSIQVRLPNAEVGTDQVAVGSATFSYPATWSHEKIDKAILADIASVILLGSACPAPSDRGGGCYDQQQWYFPATGLRVDPDDIYIPFAAR